MIENLMKYNIILLFIILIFETVSHYVSLAILELTRNTIFVKKMAKSKPRNCLLAFCLPPYNQESKSLHLSLSFPSSSRS